MNDNIFHTKAFKENLRHYEEALQNGAPIYLEPEEFTDIAEYYHLHGNLSKGIEAADKALAIFPGATEPLAFKARVAILIDHDADKAMAIAGTISDKQDLEYIYIMAEIMLADNRTSEADDYLKAQERTISDEELDDYYLDVASLFADYEVYDLAAQWLAQSSNTDDNYYLETEGRVMINDGKLKQAITLFNKLIDKDPYSNSYWDCLATAYYLSNDYSKSRESSDYALAIEPEDTDAILNKANCLMMIGDNKGARDCYMHFRQLQPQSEIGDMGLAAIDMNENKLDEAIGHWKRAAQLCAPRSANMTEIYRNMCLVLASKGDYDEALNIIQRLEEGAGGATDDSLILKGYISLLGNNIDKAKGWFSQALKTTDDEKKDNTLFYIAYCYFDCNYMEKAHDFFRYLADVAVDKTFTDLWAFLTRTDYALGLQDEFLADLKKAVSRNPAATKREFSDYFPHDLPLSDYYKYATQHPINAADKK